MPLVGERAATGPRLQPATADAAERLASSLLVASLTAAAVAQGGYHPAGRALVIVAVAAAVVVQWAGCSGGRRPTGSVGSAAVILGLLAVLAAVRAAAAGHLEAAAGWAGSVLAVVAALLLCSSFGGAARATVLDGLVWLSAVVAVAGWVGVVWHIERLATDQDAVWRGAATLTYANATCALIATTALVTLSRLADRPDDRWAALLLTVHFVGIGATLSRAGLVATTAGVVVLALVHGPRRVTAASAVPLLGALIALAGLAGSWALDSPSGRPAAVLALGTGLAVTALAHRRVPRVASLVVLTAVAAAALVTTSGALAARIHAGGGVRLAAHQAALAELADSPLHGVGPGHGPLVLPGELVPTMQYVHDEYLETALALGLLGSTLLAAGLVLLFRSTWRAVRTADQGDRALPAAATAALVASCVHAAFDFVWHVPIVPLATAVVVAAAVARHPGRTTATPGTTTRKETT